ncbi:hypothetical protein WA158_006273 [Blastocystis sp. Blastoise]
MTFYLAQVINSPVFTVQYIYGEKNVTSAKEQIKNRVTVKKSLDLIETSLNEEIITRFDFTYVTQTSAERMYYFPELLLRWPGEFSVAIYVTGDIVESTKQYMNSIQLPSRFHVVYLQRNITNEYPINTLRNMAIKGVLTSHFWLTDMDMWPSPNLYDTLHELPDTEKENKKLAVIVPAFQYNKFRGVCRGFNDCPAAMSKRIPQNKTELNACLEIFHCETFRPKQHLHDYYFPDWYKPDYNKLLTQVTCFKGQRQEPYVVVRKHNRMPMFDERFMNYGYNKVQWLEHLRYIGYRFKVLTKAFAIDIPHAKSQFQASYVNEIYVKNNSNVTVNVLYSDFIRELKQKPDRSVIKYC